MTVRAPAGRAAAAAPRAAEPPAATPDESVLQSVADAMQDAAKTASEHAVKATQLVSEAGPGALEMISGAAYTGAYVMAYGAVFAAVFVAQSMPQDNPIMHGARDGGRAAMDGLGEDPRRSSNQGRRTVRQRQGPTAGNGFKRG